MIRRTACMDPNMIDSPGVGDVRLQFSESDQRVFRQMGYMDSLDQFDLITIEGATQRHQQTLRQVHGNIQMNLAEVCLKE